MRYTSGFLLFTFSLAYACSSKPERPLGPDHSGLYDDDSTKDGKDIVGNDSDIPRNPNDQSDRKDDANADKDKSFIDDVNKMEFIALPYDSSLTKVKTLLTGKAPTSSEFETYKATPALLREYVDKWVGSPEYYKIMERFFADAFQQSQLIGTDFGSNFGDGQTFPDERLVRNYRQSFAKTVRYLIENERSFKQVATTNQFMMTTAMKVDYAFHDTSGRDDPKPNGRYAPEGKIDRMTMSEPNWSFGLTENSVPLSATMDPKNSNYLRFQVNSLENYFTGPNVKCGEVKSIIIDGNNAGTNSNRLSNWLYRFMTGGRFVYTNGPTKDGDCRSIDENEGPKLLSSEDFEDWKLVTIKKVPNFQGMDKFFDFPSLRNTTELKLITERVGFFTTQSFLAQFNTNYGNQARGITNQTMIVGLGQGFNGGNGDLKFKAPGQDDAHSKDLACYVCHNNLDPMKQYFRTNYSLNFSEQRLADVKAVAPTFIFDGIKESGSTMQDLGRQIANHPRFALAWTKKLCSFANSGECNEMDPELIRVAKIFAESDFNWNVMVRELFSSPIISYSSRTITGTLLKTTAPIARRAQLCAILEGRLELSNICGLSQVNVERDGKTVPSVALQLPADQYSRGAESGSYVTAPDPFYISAVEKVCALVADRVVDVKEGYSSAQPKIAVVNIATKLMGLTQEQLATPVDILNRHFEAIKAKNLDSVDALKSTFVLGCMSPSVTSITQ